MPKGRRIAVPQRSSSDVPLFGGDRELVDRLAGILAETDSELSEEDQLLIEHARLVARFRQVWREPALADRASAEVMAHEALMSRIGVEDSQLITLNRFIAGKSDEELKRLLDELNSLLERVDK